MGRNSDSDVMGTRVGWGASHAGEISATLAYFERAPQTLNSGPRTLGEIWQKMQKTKKLVFCGPRKPGQELLVVFLRASLFFFCLCVFFGEKVALLTEK